MDMIFGRERTIERASDTVLVVLSSALGISACFGDLVMTRLLETRYPGYRPLLQPMSDLGNSGSPVAGPASTWWVIMGLLFVAFGYGFNRAFSHQGKPLRICAWMIAVYGLGEGLGSGLVAGSPGNDFRTPNSIFHNILGGFGVLAVVLLPFFIMKVYTARRSPVLYWYSWLTSVAGILFIVLFLVSQIYQPEGSWMARHGLWQRMFVLTYYLFLICLAVLMLQRRKYASAAAEAHR